MKRILILLTLVVPGPLFAQTDLASPPRLFAVRLTTGPAWDTERSPNDQTGMREHSANIARMRGEGVLVLGARFGELGLMVLRVPDEDAVRAQLAPDPAIEAGVFAVRIDAFSPFAHGNTAYLTTPEAVLLRTYLDALNQMDTDAIVALCAEDFVWYQVTGDAAVPEVRGRAELRDWLTGHFRSTPSVHAEFLAVEQVGSFLTVRERTSWDTPEGERVSRQALGVYEVHGGLIHRVWYYPSEQEAR